MKIEDLKVGDRVKFELPRRVMLSQGEITNINGNYVCMDKDLWIPKSQITHELRIQYKEIPINRPFYLKKDLDNKYIYNWYGAIGTTISLPNDFDKTKQYTIEIKEKI